MEPVHPKIELRRLKNRLQLNGKSFGADSMGGLGYCFAPIYNNVAFVADIYIKNKKTLDHDIYKTKIQAVNSAVQGRLNSVSTDIRTRGAQDNERV